jgi:hypothetical protein
VFGRLIKHRDSTLNLFVKCRVLAKVVMESWGVGGVNGRDFLNSQSTKVLILVQHELSSVE